MFDYITQVENLQRDSFRNPSSAKPTTGRGDVQRAEIKQYNYTRAACTLYTWRSPRALIGSPDSTWVDTAFPLAQSQGYAGFVLL